MPEVISPILILLRLEREGKISHEEATRMLREACEEAGEKRWRDEIDDESTETNQKGDSKMTSQQIIKLYELQGTLLGGQDIAKCGILAAHDQREKELSEWMKGYLAGLTVGYGSAIRSCQHALNVLNPLISEVEDAEKQTPQTV